MTEDFIECPNREKNNAHCSCPKTECENHGICCQCIVSHKSRVDKPILGRLPHCLREMVKPHLAE